MTTPMTPAWNVTQSFIDPNATASPNITWCVNYVEPYCFDDSYFFILTPFKLTAAKIVSAFFMAVMIVVSLSGNILVCIAFYKYRRLRTITNYFVISLAVSDILVGSLAMPLWLSYELTEWRELPPWIEYETLTKFWQTMDILSAVSSIVNLTIISVDRFFSIMYPLRHRNFMIPMRALMFVAGAWLYALSISLSNLKNEFHGFPAFSATMGFFLPLVIIVASYSGIFIRMKKRNGITNSTHSRRMQKELKVARTILIVVSLFIFCWLPFFLFSMIYHYCRTCVFDQNALIYAVSIIKWMQYLNSCSNPFIYGFFNANFKQAFHSLFTQCCSSGPHYYPSESSDPDKQDKSSSSFRRYTSSIRRCTKRVTDSIIRPDAFRSASCSTVNTIATTASARDSLIRTKSRTSSDTSPKLSTVKELDCSNSESTEELTAFVDIQPKQAYLMNGVKPNSNGVIRHSDCNGNGLALLLDDSKESDV